MKQIIFIFILFSMFSTLHGKEKTWLINKDHSEIAFRVEYMQISSVTGRFNAFSGGVEYPEQGDPLPNKLWIYIDPSSINTGNNIRDGHLKSKDFFHDKKYTLISFESNQINPIAPNQYLATGYLKIKSIAQKINIKFSISDDAFDTWKKPSRFVSFEFHLNRHDFKLNWNKTIGKDKLLVGDKIQVNGTFQLQIRGKKTAGSKHMIPNTKYTNLKDRLFVGEISLEEYNRELIFRKQKSKLTKSEGSLPSPKKTPTIIIEKEQERNAQWYFWFYVLAALGFSGAAITPFYIKRLFQKKVANFSETNIYGILTDIPILLIIFIYAYAVWFVAYGNFKAS